MEGQNEINLPKMNCDISQKHEKPKNFLKYQRPKKALQRISYVEKIGKNQINQIHKKCDPSEFEIVQKKIESCQRLKEKFFSYFGKNVA